MITAAYARAWLEAFVFTQAVEMPVYRRGLRCSWLAAFGASALTHPVVWFVIFAPWFPGGYLAKLVLAESFAWLVEAAYFARRVGASRAVRWSLLANAASLSLGLVSRALFGHP